MAHSNTNTMNTLFDIEPISLSNDGELDNYDFDLDNESSNMIFNDADGTDNDLADIFIDHHVDDYSLITYDSIDAPQQMQEPAPQLITPQSKSKAIDLHGYNPIRSSSKNSSQDSVKKSPSYGTVYNHEMYQSSCHDIKKRPQAKTTERPLKKRRVVSCDESHNYNFEMYQNMDFQESDSSSIVLSSYHQNVQEGLQKLAESRRRTELSRRQLAMQGTSTVSSQPQPQFSRAHQIQACLSLNATAQKLHQRMAINIDNSYYKRAAFFSGSSGTLTKELEHSRRQLQMYNDNHTMCL